METPKKLFAFKLAAREDAKQGKWKAEEGRAAAGCTDYRFPGTVRYPHAMLGADRGVYG